MAVRSAAHPVAPTRKNARANAAAVRRTLMDRLQIIAARRNLTAAKGDRTSGAECVLCHLDPVGLRPCLVFSLRLGQRGRLGQTDRLTFGRGHLDYTRHWLRSCPDILESLPTFRAGVALAEVLSMEVAAGKGSCGGTERRDVLVGGGGPRKEAKDNGCADESTGQKSAWQARRLTGLGTSECSEMAAPMDKRWPPLQ